ncbi:MAG: helix-turn-helix transcriptional regulator [Acidimicrobiia bacterium]
MARAVAIEVVKFRAEHGLSQSALAKRLGVSQPVVARLTTPLLGKRSAASPARWGWSSSSRSIRPPAPDSARSADTGDAAGDAAGSVTIL